MEEEEEKEEEEECHHPTHGKKIFGNELSLPAITWQSLLLIGTVD